MPTCWCAFSSRTTRSKARPPRRCLRLPNGGNAGCTSTVWPWPKRSMCWLAATTGTGTMWRPPCWRSSRTPEWKRRKPRLWPTPCDVMPVPRWILPMPGWPPARRTLALAWRPSTAISTSSRTSGGWSRKPKAFVRPLFPRGATRAWLSRNALGERLRKILPNQGPMSALASR
jgi:hypothetical protein